MNDIGMKVRAAVPEDAAAACQVMRRSIAELCVADHRNDPAITERWLSNKTPEIFKSWIRPDNSLLVAVERWDVSPTRERSRSIMFHRMPGFAVSAAPCWPRSKTARESEAMSCARSRVPKPRGASTSPEGIPKKDLLTENSAQLPVTRCQSAWPFETVTENHLRHRFAFSISLSEMPLARAQDSTAASPYSATAFLTTQQGMA